jgi:predicted transposase YdaD
MDQVLLPKRMPGIDFSPIHNLQEAETMLAERVKQWTEEWKQQGLQEGRQEGLQEGRQAGRQEGKQEGMRQGQEVAQRAIARALLDIISDDLLLAERTGVPAAEIEAMRREQDGLAS